MKLDRRTFLRKLVPGTVGDQDELESVSSQNGEALGDGDTVVTLSADSCLAFQGCMCFSCREVCPEDAIHFSGLFEPAIVEESCTGCALCIPVCPTSALTKGDRSHINSQETIESNLIGLDDLLA